MSASKLALYGIGTALFRTPPTLRTLSSTSPFLFPKPFVPFTLKSPPCFLRRTSSTAVVDTVTTDDDAETLSCSGHHHPWPEWISFLDRLKSSGYLPEPSPSSAAATEGEHEVGAAESVYSDMKLLKDACLRFARDRYDIFKLLSLKDIQAVVEEGCPNLLRKVVNSAKRLRAHVRLDEGDVCSACNLRGSCDRAYVILKEFEAVPRTVDIVRILLFYALDPLVISGGEKAPGREVIESSARKLLSQLIELSESSPAPAQPKSTTQDAVAKCQPISFMTKKLSTDVEMKKGDWMCPKCNFLNFARNMQCLNCKEDKPGDIGQPTIEMKKGDWICPECSFMNFSRNVCCRKCKAEGPKRVSTDSIERKSGDWDCPKCGFMNFASNVKCLRCPQLRPKQHAGDWSCPKCHFFNYSRNTVCLKCNTKRTEEQTTSDYEEHIWRR